MGSSVAAGRLVGALYDIGLNQHEDYEVDRAHRQGRCRAGCRECRPSQLYCLESSLR